MAGKFALQVGAFRDKCNKRGLAIFRQSTQEVAQRAGVPQAQGGKMPVDTEFLRGSVAGSKSGMPGASAQPPEIVLLSVQLGETIYVGWTANYAIYMEYRYGFLRSQIQNWDFIVAEVTAEVRRRFP